MSQFGRSPLPLVGGIIYGWHLIRSLVYCCKRYRSIFLDDVGIVIF